MSTDHIEGIWVLVMDWMLKVMQHRAAEVDESQSEDKPTRILIEVCGLGYRAVQRTGRDFDWHRTGRLGEALHGELVQA